MSRVWLCIPENQRHRHIPALAMSEGRKIMNKKRNAASVPGKKKDLYWENEEHVYGGSSSWIEDGEHIDHIRRAKARKKKI